LNARADALIARLEGTLDPAHREGFRAAAEAAVPPAARGHGSTYHEVTKIWRGYFRPPTATHMGPRLRNVMAKRIIAA
jgi:hypothetical protein